MTCVFLVAGLQGGWELAEAERLVSCSGLTQISEELGNVHP